jgi:hypothetical protein
VKVTITDVERDAPGAAENVDRFVVPFVAALRDAYIDAGVSDEESATVDLLTDLLVYAHRREAEDVHALAARAARAAEGELLEARG